MKKKFLKIFSIVMCAFILAPNTPAVLAGDSDDEYSSNSSQSTNQSDNNCICIACCYCGTTFLQNKGDIETNYIDETENGIGFQYNDTIECPGCHNRMEVNFYDFSNDEGECTSDLGAIGGRCKEEVVLHNDDNDSSSSSQSISQSDDNSSDGKPYNDEQEIDDLSKKTMDMNINKHEIDRDFDVFQKMNKKRQLVENGIKAKNYRYVAAFIANKFEKECKDRGGSFDFCTPFGKVKIAEPIKNGERIFDCLVSCKNDVMGDYGSLSKHLDECTESELIQIYNYLSMYYNKNLLKNREFDIDKFNEKVKEQFGDIAEIEPTDERQASFAVFCGVLMGAEPWRFKDGGGLSRGTIRTVYKILNKLVTFKVINDGGQFVIERLPYNDECKIENPYGFVFGESGPGGEALAVFAHKAFCSEGYKKEHPDTKLEVDKSKQWRLKQNKDGQRRKDYTGGKRQQLKQLDKDCKIYSESKESIEDNRKRMETLNLDISDDEGVIDDVNDITKKLDGLKINSKGKTE